MDRAAKSRIALFGGTFDPVHVGHLEFIQSLLRSSITDQVWILPAPVPPHKPNLQPTPYAHRKAMLERALEDLPESVSICEIERSLPTPSYTVQTLRELQSVFPGSDFFLSIGMDSLQSFHTWKESHELLGLTSLLVAKRPGWNLQSVSREILDRTIILDHTEVDISSSEIRKAYASGVEGRVEWVPESVDNYIQEQNLYFNG